jgi:hypothetical protein
MSSFLGPSYDYWKNVKQPREMNMSPGFSLRTLANNVDGLLSYVEVLVTGGGNASVTRKPLGNKFFLKTTGKCSATNLEKWKKEQKEDEQWEKTYEDVEKREGSKKITEDEAKKLKNALTEQKKQRDKAREGSKEIVDRYIYVNNIPDGSIPFIASGADGNTFRDLRGLIPGAMGNLGALNPIPLFKAFTAGTYPDCSEITLETINEKNQANRQTEYLALVDVAEMNPCSFPNQENPVSGARCRGSEGFGKLGSEKSTTTAATADEKEKTTDIYNKNQYMLVSENGESIGIYETGSLAGSSGIAYQTTSRSPLSYNVEISKGSPMSELSFAKFGPDSSPDRSMKDVIDERNSHISSFFKDDLEMIRRLDGQDHDNEDVENGYESLLAKLSKLINRIGGRNSNENGNGHSKDLSSIEGDTLSQIYYHSITLLMLYLLYRILYAKNQR